MKKLINFFLMCICFLVMPVIIPIIALIGWSQSNGKKDGYSNFDESYFDVLKQCYREFGWL